MLMVVFTFVILKPVNIRHISSVVLQRQIDISSRFACLFDILSSIANFFDSAVKETRT